MSLTLTEEPQQFILQHGDLTVTIDRLSGEIFPSEKTRVSGATPRPVAGIIGIIQLLHSKYLIVANSARRVGSLDGGPVFQVTSTEIIGYNGSEDRDSEYLSLLRSHLDEATFFFSPTYDLTSSSQRAHQLVSADAKSTIDDRFFWNYEISRELFNFPKFVFPMIYGVVSIESLTIQGEAAEFAVISRRSRFRAGTRYFRRGLDNYGNVANFNETEQLLFIDGRKFSFLQTRGSVPALWSEINNLHYKPQLRIGEISASVAAAEKHFKEQKKRYGDQFLVNLVNQEGYEKPVKEVYEAIIQQLKDPKLHYVYFDFHHECSKMRWHRVKLLVDQLVTLGLDRAMWFETYNGKAVRQQTGVVRTNCMDCLDRTNVVQSTLALYALERQLQAAGILADGSSIATDPKFIAKFRNIWADNADGISCAYSGTGALKTDFTRTGQRTKLGALQDLRNSIVRYYKNNLRDGPRQDAFTLFLQEYVPSANESPFLDKRSLWIQSIPYVFGGCSLVAVLSVMYPSETHGWLFNSIVTLMFSGVAYLSLKFIFAHGLQFVNWPRLSSVRFVQWTPRQGYQIEGEHNSTKEE